MSSGIIERLYNEEITRLFHESILASNVDYDNLEVPEASERLISRRSDSRARDAVRVASGFSLSH